MDRILFTYKKSVSTLACQPPCIRLSIGTRSFFQSERSIEFLLLQGMQKLRYLRFFSYTRIRWSKISPLRVFPFPESVSGKHFTLRKCAQLIPPQKITPKGIFRKNLKKIHAILGPSPLRVPNIVKCSSCVPRA